MTANRAQGRQVLAKGLLVLTDVEPDGQALLVIPRDIAVAELTTWSTLSHASTFGEARADRRAAELVGEWLPRYVEHLEAQGEASSGADSEAFDAREFFGDDNLGAWTPDPRELTARWLQHYEPELAHEYLQPDTGWGFDYPPWPLIDARRRQTLEARLRARVHEVWAVAGMAGMFLDPPINPGAML